MNFDLTQARQRRDVGMNHAAQAREDLLKLARPFAYRAAVNRPDRTASIDDVAKAFEDYGLSMRELGNAAGSVFKNTDLWEHVGWKQSERVSNHGRHVKVWRLL